MDAYSKLHKALITKQEGKTTAHQLAGENVDYFAALHNKLHRDKFELLVESIMLSYLQNYQYTKEDHQLIRLGMHEILDAFMICNNEVQERK